MPSLQHWLKTLSISHPSSSSSSSSSRPPPPPSGPITVYFLSTPSPADSTFSGASAAAGAPLTPIAPPNVAPISPSTLLFSLTHPRPGTSDPASFFFEALPDPVGFLFHAAQLIRAHLSGSANVSGSGGLEARPGWRWRHQMIELALVDEDGLAWTSGGRMSVSLRWMGNLLQETRNGSKDMRAAAKEIKGVLLHELVHVIQRDGSGTCPMWLVESLADHIRLRAHLDPPHWRKAGVGRRDKGWEEGYDAGAWFLCWLVGVDPANDAADYARLRVEDVGGPHGDGQGGASYKQQGAAESMREPTTASTEPTTEPTQPIQPTRTREQRPMTTQYPLPSSGEPGMGRQSRGTGTTTKRRRGPFPDFVRLLDTRLEHESYSDAWWAEMTGAELPTLWAEYLDWYA